jgi:N-succinyldiaminopimelate aminotransferase
VPDGLPAVNPLLDRLQPYPFERLRVLLNGVAPPPLPAIRLSIGEPQHPTPDLVRRALTDNLDGLSVYPLTVGLDELRDAIAAWFRRRYDLASLDAATEVLPVNGTREALFAFVQSVVGSKPRPVVAMPNPFYQIYEGAALLAGAEPWFLNTNAGNGYIPDLDAVPAEIWNRCEVLFLCNPGNPAGATAPRKYLEHALDLAEKHDFIIAADECYAEIYLDEAAPPPSLLEAALATGRDKFQRCLVFHSLSKRSSVPGLRSGFVAGDASLISKFLLYCTYHGSAMAVPTQLASVAAWDEDTHSANNRKLYQDKFARVLPILQPVLDVRRPDGAFYLWPDVGGDDEEFVRQLFAEQNLTLLPGSYLAREANGENPGARRVRISLTAGVDSCIVAAERIRAFISKRR